MRRVEMQTILDDPVACRNARAFRAYRENQKMTSEELGGVIGVTPRIIDMIENYPEMVSRRLWNYAGEFLGFPPYEGDYSEYVPLSEYGIHWDFPPDEEEKEDGIMTFPRTIADDPIACRNALSIYAIRTSRGLSQLELAEEIGVSRATISLLENTPEVISPRLWNSICEYFDFPRYKEEGLTVRIPHEEYTHILSGLERLSEEMRKYGSKENAQFSGCGE